MTTDSTLIEIPDLVANANIVKEMVLNRLEHDGVITKRQEKEYNESWQIIVIKNGWFKTWAKKWQKDESKYSYKYLKFDESEQTNELF